MTWAFAKAEALYPSLFKKVEDHIVALNNLEAFKEQNISNIVWAFAKAEIPHTRLLERVADHIVALDNLEAFDP
eukprot:CAMPEP_0172313282 /NCGR_PEP_ID=MMETSP1058-20130122/19936_1 /TAXON_ID=83371 /ORGANISM="Detonula confervacea, Strain CCMP 353" /LENGTH=73 /DNA_ID=CAMNT_0013026913 /DNA_START=1 /DNA_END=218 /DNA_ORIENTATION=-